MHLQAGNKENTVKQTHHGQTLSRVCKSGKCSSGPSASQEVCADLSLTDKLVFLTRPKPSPVQKACAGGIADKRCLDKLH